MNIPNRPWLSFHEDRGVVIDRHGNPVVWPDGDCLGIDPEGIVAAGSEQKVAQQVLELVSLQVRQIGHEGTAQEQKRAKALTTQLATCQLPETYQEILVNLERLINEEYQR